MAKKNVPMFLIITITLAVSSLVFADTVISKSGAVIKIVVPQHWTRAKVVDAAGPSAIATFIARDEAKNIISLMNISDHYNKEYGKKDSDILRMKFLEEFKNRLTKLRPDWSKKNPDVWNGEWLSEKYDRLCGVPCLFITIRNKANNIHVLVYFIKGKDFYYIKFYAQDNNIFDKEWPIIEKNLKNMEIQSAGK
jgi:hypothetical protein